MNRFKTLVLTLSLILIGILPILADSKAETWNYPSSNPGLSSFEGSGTASSPYLIKSAQDLANLAYIVTDANKDLTGKYFKMTRDIYLNDFTVDAKGKITANGDLKKWTPIGEYGSLWDDDFQGIFDGDNHTIYGLYIKEISGRKYVGLFGSTEDATIKNLTVKNAYVHVEPSKDGIESGTLVGSCTNSTISNVSVVDCYILATNPTTAFIYQGGLIGRGYNDITLNDCSFDGTIYIPNCVNTAYVGGLIGSYTESGLNDNITLRLTRCQTKGEINLINKSETMIELGGFVGEAYKSYYEAYITDCVNRTNLIVDSDSNATQHPRSIYVHNLVFNAVEIKRSVNLGDITIASNKLKPSETSPSCVLLATSKKYIDCANYGHYFLPKDNNGIEVAIDPGLNQTYHGKDGQNLIVWKEAKPTNLGANDTYESNGTELSVDSLNNNYRQIIAKLNEEAGENVWGSYVLTENGKIYTVPFPISCGGTPIGLYKNMISSEADLRILYNLVKSGTVTDDYFLLTHDIDMSASAPLTQIGDETHPFTGTFDGNRHVISGLTIKGHALFGNLSGTVKNLGLVNMKFVGGNAQCAPFAYKAGVAADASILNCYAGGNVTLADSTNTFTALAGLLYEASDHNVSIKNSYFRGVMANATNVSNQSHAFYGMVGSNQISTNLSLADSYTNFDYDDNDALVNGIMPTTYTAYQANCHYLCPKISDLNGQLKSNAELAACFAGKEGWLTGAYRPVLENARHYTLTTYDEQTVYADAIPLDDDSCRNEIFCYHATTETVNDPLVWALPKVAVCDTENNVNYLLNYQLYADKPFRFTPPKGSVTKGQMHFPLTFTGDYVIRLMCLPATLHKNNLPEGTELMLMGKPIGSKDEGYSSYAVACDSVPAGVPFLIYINNKPTEAIDVVLRGDIVSTPQTSGTLNDQELKSGLVGTFEDKHINGGCVQFNVDNTTLEYQEDIDLKPFDAYLDADATVRCDGGVLLKETSNYISETLDMYKGRKVTVFLSRQLHAEGWNTLCLPFDISEEEVISKFGDLGCVEELTSITTEADGSCTLNFTKASSIEAGKCYLIKPAAAFSSWYQFDNKTLCTEPIATTLTSPDGSFNISFMGSFARTAIDGNDTSKGTYFTQDNKLYKVAQGRTITMNGFRCWIETSKADALTKANIAHSDGTTSIANIVYIGTTENNNRIYDIQGIETNHPDDHHIYIKNGRKWVGTPGAQTR